MNKTREALLSFPPNAPIQYVLDHGRPFEEEPLTREETKKIRVGIRKARPAIKTCFYNAIKLWHFDHDFKYCEGYISAFEDKIVVPTYHAWNTINGKLVEITPMDHYQYYGVVFSDEVTSNHYITTQKAVAATRNWYPLIENWQMNFPFLVEQGYME